MSELKLHPDIEGLEQNNPARYSIYVTLLNGMKEANSVTPTDFNVEPYSKPTGEIWIDPDGNQIPLMAPDTELIAAKLAEDSETQLKNSAYMFASAINTAGGSSGSGSVDLSALIQRSGDSMTGLLGALMGFEAGYNGAKIFDVALNAQEKKVAHVYGSLIVDEDARIDGKLNLSDDGIYFNGQQSIYYKDGKLNISSSNIAIDGDIVLDGSFSIGDVQINKNGLSLGDNVYYHSGNCNTPTVDWAMKDAHVYGNLIIDGNSTFDGRLVALKGFDLGEGSNKYFWSEYDDETQEGKISFRTDLHIVGGYGIKFEDDYIIKARSGANGVISFSAPNKVLNLGDAGGTLEAPQATKYISLQADIMNDRNTYVMVSANGDGWFQNSFQAGCGNSGPIVIRTYYSNADDCGIVTPKLLAIGDEHGPKISVGDSNEVLRFSIPYAYNQNGNFKTDSFPFTLTFGESGYQWRNGVNSIDRSLHFDTDAEFFLFHKPILTNEFCINSDKYQTRLKENALFFDTGVFMEGVPDGVTLTGNAYFNGNIGSTKFASGLAGYGWGIIRDELTGTICATVDELVVRKRMKVFELDVQKQNVSNGSLWITDSCSGDNVEEL